MLSSWLPHAPEGSVVVVTDGFANYTGDLSRYRFLKVDDGTCINDNIIVRRSNIRIRWNREAHAKESADGFERGLQTI